MSVVKRATEILKRGEPWRRAALVAGGILALFVLWQVAIRAMLLLPWIVAAGVCLYFGLEEKGRK